MTETEYITVSNRVRVTQAKTALLDVFPDCGVNEHEIKSLVAALSKIETRLFSLIDVTT